MQRLGIGIGPHLNAATAFDFTSYIQSVPNTENETLSVVLNWYRDVMDGALLEEREIEAERGVIISEMEVRDSVQGQVNEELWSWQYPDHLLSKRNIAGTDETIMAMTKEMFLEFYEKWYTPRRATFVVVGDMDTTDMVKFIETTFSSVKDPGDRAEDPDLGLVPEGTGLVTKVIVNSGLPDDAISMTVSHSVEWASDTKAKRIQDLQRNFAHDIVANRFLDIVLQSNSTLQFGGAFPSTFFNIEYVTITVYPVPGVPLEAAVATMEQEWRRALTYGFTQFEVDQVKADWLNFYEQGVLSKDSRDSTMLVEAIIDNINVRSVYSTPEEDLRVFVSALDGTTTEVLHEVFRAYWDTEDISLYWLTPSVEETVEEAAQELETAFLASQSAEVAPPVEEEKITWAYSGFGAPGTVIEDTFVEDLQVRQMILSNNMRVNMKHTDVRT